MQLFLWFWVFVMGMCVGSFVNVLIWRTLHGMSPYRGRSVCDHCKRQLSWYENIPVISFVLLGGKCRTCKKKIDWSYPLVELVTGILFLWWATLGFAFFKITLSPLSYFQPFFWLIVGINLVIIFFADLLYGIIPDFTVAILGISTLVYRIILVTLGIMQVSDFWSSVWVGVGVGGFYLGLFFFTRGNGMGLGDVKLAPVLGFLLGFPEGLVATFVGFIIGGVLASLLLMLHKKKVGQTVPFGPFMVLGAVIGLLWGNQLWNGYMIYLYR